MSYLSPLPRQHFVLIDAIKFVMAFMVVLIHADFLGAGHMSDAEQWVSKLAVPFFFISSSFFIGMKLRNISDNTEKSAIMKRRALSLGKALIVWELISIVFILAFKMETATNTHEWIFQLLYAFITRGQNHISLQIWFLYAMSLNFFIIALLLKSRHAARLISVYFCVALIIFSLKNPLSAGNPHISFIYDTANYNYFPIIYVVPGLALGYYGIPTGKTIWGVALLALSVAAFNISDHGAGLLGGVGIFLLCLFPVHFISHDTARALRTLSIYIYLLHMMVMFLIIRYVPARLGLWELATATFLVSLAIGELMRRGAATPRFAFLRHLAV